ncbi:MAG: hypothetical protein U1E28_02150 [Beijerinckiaceae bacterium]
MFGGLRPQPPIAERRKHAADTLRRYEFGEQGVHDLFLSDRSGNSHALASHFPFLPFVLALVIVVLDAGSRRAGACGHRTVAMNTLDHTAKERGRAAQTWRADGRLAGLKKFLDAIVIRLGDDLWNRDGDDLVVGILAPVLVHDIPQPLAGIGFAGQNFVDCPRPKQATCP